MPRVRDRRPNWLTVMLLVCVVVLVLLGLLALLPSGARP